MDRLYKILISALIFLNITACSTSYTAPPTAAPTTASTAAPTATPTVAPTIPEATEKPYTEAAYIGNKNSKKFHRPDCSTLPEKKNRVPLDSKEEAVDRGYSPCRKCCP